MYSIRTILIAVLLFSVFSNAKSQTRPWLQNSYFSPGVSISSALIKINGAVSSYDELLKVEDTSILKIEVYNKKTAAKLFGKESGKNAVVFLTTRTPKLLEYPVETTTDSAKYFIMNGDTAFLKTSTNATIGGDTSRASWNKFLEKNLNAQVPADNGAPPGRYNVTVRFFVSTDGSVSGATIDEDPGYGTGPEVLRLISHSAAWQPAVYNGRLVKAYLRQVITFEVSEM